MLDVLAEMGPAAREAVPLLIDLLDEALAPVSADEGPRPLQPYLETLGRLGAEAKAATLASLIAIHKNSGPGEYDVSAPGIGVFHKD